MKAQSFFLADEHELLDKPNVSLQGSHTTFLDLKRNFNAFGEMTMVWGEQLD